MSNDASPPSKNMFIIGIAGPSGSGKTTLANTLLRMFPNDAAVVSTDSYYHANWDIPFEERIEKNYDEPEAFDVDLMFSQVQALKNGQSIQIPIYDFARHKRNEDTTIELQPKKVVLVEGILLLHMDKMRPLLDRTVFVSTPSDVCKKRRIHRDRHERGRDVEGALAQYDASVAPMLEKYVLPSKAYADLAFEMFPGFQENDTFKAIAHDIKQHIAKV